MKILNTSNPQISQLHSTRSDSRSVKDSRASTTIKQTSKTRNFGWLVKGMVEACHQISAEDLD